MLKFLNQRCQILTNPNILNYLVKLADYLDSIHETAGANLIDKILHKFANFAPSDLLLKGVNEINHELFCKEPIQYLSTMEPVHLDKLLELIPGPYKTPLRDPEYDIYLLDIPTDHPDWLKKYEEFQNLPEHQKYEKRRLKVISDYIDPHYKNPVSETAVNYIPWELRLENYVNYFNGLLKVYEQEAKAEGSTLDDYIEMMGDEPFIFGYSDPKFMDYLLVQKLDGEVDWRHTETLPEDYYAL